MISPDKIEAAVRTLVAEAQPEQVIVFGSHARGDARADSDLDLLVIETSTPDRAQEMVRLRRALRPLRIPVDVLVFSREDVQRWGDTPGTVLHSALREGKVLYG